VNGSVTRGGLPTSIGPRASPCARCGRARHHGVQLHAEPRQAARLIRDPVPLHRGARRVRRSASSAHELQAIGTRSGDPAGIGETVRETAQGRDRRGGDPRGGAAPGPALCAAKRGTAENTRYSNLVAESSAGKWPRARTARLTLEFKASMAFVCDNQMSRHFNYEATQESFRVRPQDRLVTLQ
jgi:hypothetical protein